MAKRRKNKSRRDAFAMRQKVDSFVRTNKIRRGSKYPFLKPDGSPDTRYKISKYLKKSGTIDKRKLRGVPSSIKTLPALYRWTKAKGSTVAKELPIWNKDGTINQKLEISKWLTKDGKLDKRRKLPDGVRGLKGLYAYLNQKKVNYKNKDKLLRCSQDSVPTWEFKAYLNSKFQSFVKVFYSGRHITLSHWEQYQDEIIEELTNPKQSPPTVYFEICADKQYRTFKYLFF